MAGFILAFIIVAGVRSFAFRGTNPQAFMGDIAALAILTIVLNMIF